MKRSKFILCQSLLRIIRRCLCAPLWDLKKFIFARVKRRPFKPPSTHANSAWWPRTAAAASSPESTNFTLAAASPRRRRASFCPSTSKDPTRSLHSLTNVVQLNQSINRSSSPSFPDRGPSLSGFCKAKSSRIKVLRQKVSGGEDGVAPAQHPVALPQSAL